jgi:hypothetical protein
VDAAGIPLEPDAFHAWATRQESYEAHAAGSSAVAYAFIPPERLTLHHDGRSAR